jgi:hypothetical protein
MSHRIGIVAEDVPDARTVRLLTDRVICESNPPDWITDDTIDHFRSYCGVEDSTPFLKWTRVEKGERGGVFLPIRSKRFRLSSTESLRAYRALIEFATLPAQKRVDAVMLSRDADAEPERQQSLEEARQALNLLPMGTNERFRVIIAFANTKRECWHICGFEPTEHEQSRLEELQSGADGLGFDPRSQSQQLSASSAPENFKRSAKRVLDHLTGGNQQRELECLQTPLDVLEERGEHNGLQAFLREIRTILLPMFGGLADSHG